MRETELEKLGFSYFLMMSFLRLKSDLGLKMVFKRVLALIMVK